MKQDPRLFQMVKNTLKTLQGTFEPFIMVIFAGQLSEISDPHSPLIQTIKYVVESTLQETTLIILTGSCPVNEPNVVVINENIDCQKRIVPIFAKGCTQNNFTLNKVLHMHALVVGPSTEKLLQCQVLYDIPLVIRNLLEESSPNFRG